MRTVPKPVSERIRYFRAHVGPFTDRAEQIGLTPADAAELAAAVDAAAAAELARAAAELAARAATQRLRDAVKTMSKVGARLILKVRATAGLEGTGVYTLAQVRPPAKKSRVGKPGTPTALKHELSAATGAMKLSWPCKHPEGCEGVAYEISRQLDGDGPFVHLAMVGKKAFVDETLPAGTAAVTYQIRAKRSTGDGGAAQFTLHLGVTPATARLLRVTRRPERGTALAPAAMAA